jgi:hypothetical protein
MSASIFQRLYDSEINFEVSCFFDGGFNVRLGDEINGFAAQDQLDSWDQVDIWLHHAALKFYPNSGYAKQELGSEWSQAQEPRLELTCERGKL